jgi:hypothetical protein
MVPRGSRNFDDKFLSDYLMPHLLAVQAVQSQNGLQNRIVVDLP